MAREYTTAAAIAIPPATAASIFIRFGETLNRNKGSIKTTRKS